MDLKKILEKKEIDGKDYDEIKEYSKKYSNTVLVVDAINDEYDLDGNLIRQTLGVVRISAKDGRELKRLNRKIKRKKRRWRAYKGSFYFEHEFEKTYIEPLEEEKEIIMMKYRYYDDYEYKDAEEKKYKIGDILEG